MTHDIMLQRWKFVFNLLLNTSILRCDMGILIRMPSLFPYGNIMRNPCWWPTLYILETSVSK